MEGRDLRYLLHLWRDEGGEVKASLRDVADGELRLFVGLDELREFLEASIDLAPASGQTPSQAQG